MPNTELMFHCRRCARCGKEFIIHGGKWAYRSDQSNSALLFCSWSCLQAWRQGKSLRKERQNKIIQAICDGLSIEEIATLLNEDKKIIHYWKKKIEREAAENGKEQSKSD